MEDQNPLFPVFLKLEALNVLVVGGGNVALEKLTAVYENSPLARVVLVAPLIIQPVKNLLERNKGTYRQGEFIPADTTGIRIAIVAVNDKVTSAAIRAACVAENILTNVADTPDLCDFYLGAVVTKGQLKIAISTNGKSPTIAKRIKEVVSQSLPDGINRLLLNMEQLRSRLTGDFTHKVNRLNEITAGLSDHQEKKDPS